MRNHAIALTAIAAAMLSWPATSMAADVTKMRCSHQLPPKHHIAQVIDKWAAEVEAQSAGEIDVEIFGAASLVNPRQNIPSVAKGDIECAFSVNFQWGKTLPIMNVTLAPFAFSSIDIWKKWPKSDVAAYLEEKLLDKGVKNVVWLFTTNTSVFTSKGRALIKPSDFEGIKIRGLGKVPDTGLAAMGAVPASMPGSEVYQALATGVIDAGVTDVSAAYSRKYYEVQDHMTVLPLISVYFHGYVTPDFYNGLSDKSKAALASAGEMAAAWAIEASSAAAADAPGKLAEKGVKVHMATEEEIAALKKVMAPAFDKAFEEQTGAEGKQLLDLVNKL